MNITQCHLRLEYIRILLPVLPADDVCGQVVICASSGARERPSGRRMAFVERVLGYSCRGCDGDVFWGVRSERTAEKLVTVLNVAR